MEPEDQSLNGGRRALLGLGLRERREGEADAKARAGTDRSIALISEMCALQSCQPRA